MNDYCNAPHFNHVTMNNDYTLNDTSNTTGLLQALDTVQYMIVIRDAYYKGGVMLART